MPTTAVIVIEDNATNKVETADAIDMATTVRTADRNKTRMSNIKLDLKAFQFKQNGKPQCSPK
jgi:hypothetical protein